MALNLKINWADADLVQSDAHPDNPIVSVDFEGKTLSRLDDPVWIFPSSANNPSARRFVYWPNVSANNVADAKQLALLRLTHGRALGSAGALILATTLARLATFCAEKNISVRALHRHPQVAIDFCQESGGKSRRSYLTSLARLTNTMRQELGWVLLDDDQVRAIEAIEELETRQYAVIPGRILRNFDDATSGVLSRFMGIADAFEDFSKIWRSTSYSERAKGKSPRGRDLALRWPRLGEEIQRWAPDAPAPIGAYLSVVRVAAFWEIAGGSCARRSEILSLRRGCLTQESVGDRQAYLLSAETTKTQSTPHAIWVVSPRAKLAIQALERILDWYERVHPSPPNATDFLFQVFDLSLGRRMSPSQIRKGKLNYGEPYLNLDFSVLTSATDAVITREDWEEAKQLTPSLDEQRFAIGKVWIPSAHQMRRTVLVRAAASGLISQDSLSFQAKHQTWQMTSYYCRNYWHLANSDPNNPLVRGTSQADAEAFTTIYADSYNEARKVAIESNRFFSPYGSEHKRITIEATPLLSLADIKSGQAAAVLKRNTLGLCAQADFCQWQLARAVRGCLTKADGGTCSKAIVDTAHLSDLKALKADLEYRLESLRVTDHFARAEIQADIEAAAQAIALIEQHEGARSEEPA